MPHEKEVTEAGLVEHFVSKLLKTKNPDDMIADSKETGLNKTLNWVDLIILGIGAVIGAGIFSMVGSAVVGTNGHPGAGPALVISMIIAAIACIFSALCYAEFASMIPVSGGVYTYTFATMGELAAWMVGWVLMLQYTIGNIAVACSWTGYLLQFLRGFEPYTAHLPAALQSICHHIMYPPLWLVSDYGTASAAYVKMGLNPAEHIPHLFGLIPISINVPAIAMILLVTAILVKGISESKNMAGIMVVIKLLVIALFIGVGAFYVKPGNWVPFMPNGIGSVLISAFTIFFAYTGFDAISTAAEETKNPQKDVPIGIIGTLLACTVVYIFVALVLTGVVKWDMINIHAPIAHAMQMTGQNWVAGLISVGALTGLTSVLLVMQLAATRILFAMARDNFFPTILKKVHPVYKTPHVITWLVGSAMVIGCLFLDLNLAAQLCIFSVFTSFIIVCIGVLILRKTDPNRHRPFKVPFSPFFPAMGILLCGTLMCVAIASMGKTALLFPLWLLIGLSIYAFYGYKRNRRIEGIEERRKANKEAREKAQL
ncbi:TPA: amino acid permease [Candidatus Spyradomonas excrementavium]|nr:amino acid permease [Candidatus Spyradomonas excrementavium]